MSVQFTVVEGQLTTEHTLAWGERLLIRTDGPVTVFATAPRLSSVSSGRVSVPLLRRPSESVATVVVDGSRSTGAIRVEAALAGHPPARLDLLQSAAEEALTEFLRSIRLAEVALPRLKGGFVYLDSISTPRRAVDPIRIASFVIDNAAVIEALVTNISERPHTATEQVFVRRPPGANVDPHETRRFLLAHPEFLHPSPSGVVKVRDQMYAPSMAIVRQRRETVDTIEHRRVARFLARLWSESGASFGLGQVKDGVALQLQVARSLLSKAMNSTFFGDLSGPENDDLVLEATALEASDMRYQELYRLRWHYLTEVSPNGDTEQLERQHLARPDEIYQALCATLVAQAFDLRCNVDAPGQPMYVSDEWELWVNRVGALNSWRTDTAKPDDYRPDLVLRRVRQPSHCVLLDAKYAVDSSGGVPGERLKEVQAYLNAFGLQKAGILYPGPMERARTVEHTDIASQPFLLREIPLRAVEPSELGVVLSNLRDRCLELEDTATIQVKVAS